MGEWSSAIKGENRDDAAIRSVMSLRTEPMFRFDTLAELHGELVALTMKTTAARGGPGQSGSGVERSSQ